MTGEIVSPNPTLPHSALFNGHHIAHISERKLSFLQWRKTFLPHLGQILYRWSVVSLFPLSLSLSLGVGFFTIARTLTTGFTPLPEHTMLEKHKVQTGNEQRNKMKLDEWINLLLTCYFPLDGIVFLQLSSYCVAIKASSCFCLFVRSPISQGDLSQQEKRAVFLTVHDLGTNRKYPGRQKSNEQKPIHRY